MRRKKQARAEGLASETSEFLTKPATVTVDFGDEEVSYTTTYLDAVRYGEKFNEGMREANCPFRCRVTFEP